MTIFPKDMILFLNCFLDFFHGSYSIIIVDLLPTGCLGLRTFLLFGLSFSNYKAGEHLTLKKRSCEST